MAKGSLYTGLVTCYIEVYVRKLGKLRSPDACEIGNVPGAEADRHGKGTGKFCADR